MEGDTEMKETQSQVAPVNVVKQKVTIQDDAVIMNGIQQEVIKGNADTANAKAHSPAHFELNAAAEGRLIRLVRDLGNVVNQVDHVRACVAKGTKKVYIWPADDEDPLAIPVNRFSDKAWINLADLLIPLKLTVEVGYWERYAVQFAPKDGHVTPALLIDMDLPLERKTDTRSRSKAKATASKSKATAKAPEAQPQAPAPEAAETAATPEAKA